VLLPTVSKDGQPKKTIRLRCVTEPDPGQKVLLHRLGIELPLLPTNRPAQQRNLG